MGKHVRATEKDAKWQFKIHLAVPSRGHKRHLKFWTPTRNFMTSNSRLNGTFVSFSLSKRPPYSCDVSGGFFTPETFCVVQATNARKTRSPSRNVTFDFSPNFYKIRTPLPCDLTPPDSRKKSSSLVIVCESELWKGTEDVDIYHLFKFYTISQIWYKSRPIEITVYSICSTFLAISP